MRRKFYRTCVGWPDAEMSALHALIDDSSPISRDDFLPLVSVSQMRQIESELGYDRHLRMADDWHVSYHLHPSGVPFFVHSAIEHVFADPAEISALAIAADLAGAEPRAFLIDDIASLYEAEALDPEAYDDRLTEFLDTFRSGIDDLLIIDEGDAISRLHAGLRAQLALAVGSGRKRSGILRNPGEAPDLSDFEKILADTEKYEPSAG